MSDIDEVFLEELWRLVDDWRDLAHDQLIHLPFLAQHPRSAHSQGLIKAAGELENHLLQWDERLEQ